MIYLRKINWVVVEFKFIIIIHAEKQQCSRYCRILSKSKNLNPVRSGKFVAFKIRTGPVFKKPKIRNQPDQIFTNYNFLISDFNEKEITKNEYIIICQTYLFSGILLYHNCNKKVLISWYQSRNSIMTIVSFIFFKPDESPEDRFLRTDGKQEHLSLIYFLLAPQRSAYLSLTQPYL